jgi:CheY-like chemotaxis protein
MSPSTLRPVEILLVEDSPTDRLIAIEALKQGSVINNLHTVENGLEVMAYLRRQGKFADAPRPDLILLDLNLPKKDGREVLIEIKSDELLRLIPVVVLTTSDAEDDVISSYGHYANSFIRKPVDFAAFARIVQSIGNYWFQVVTLPGEDALRHARRAATPRLPAAVAAGDQRLRVLLIEDDPATVVLVRDMLQRSRVAQFDVEAVDRVAAVAKRADLDSFDVVLADLGLPDSQGLDTCHRIRALVHGTPVVVLTGLDDEAMGLRALRQGAQDYVVKGDMTGRSLGRAVRYAVDRTRLEAHLQQEQRLEAVGQLAAGVAHDFNNLLTVIQGQGLALKETVASAEDRGAVEDILDAARRAADLTRQLLTFSGKQILQPQVLDVNEVIGGVTRMLRRLLGAGISLELQLTAEPTRVHADRGMLEQVIVNLALNARDAMPAGGKLTMSTAVLRLDRAAIADPDEYPGHFVKLVVSDTGVGIPADVLPHVFEPFFTTKDVGKGSGLGLATARSIVQQHRGWMRVTSVPLAGTRFEIVLPLTAQAPATPPAPLRGGQGGGETILVVEDEPSVRRVAVAGLERKGYRVLSASSGVEALRIWDAHGPEIDLLFTDLVMPDGIGGQELADRLRAARPTLPVVFTSGYSDRFLQASELREGVNFLQKPYTLNALTATVRNGLGRARSA